MTPDEKEGMSDSQRDNTKYVDGFMSELREVLEKDFLLRFNARLIAECVNIEKVIEKASKTDIKRLEVIIENFKNPDAKPAPGVLGVTDSLFHIELFQITENNKMVQTLSDEMLNPQGSHVRIWQSICRNQFHKEELCTCHSKLIESIRDKKKDEAVKMIQKHFALIVPHFASILR